MSPPGPRLLLSALALVATSLVPTSVQGTPPEALRGGGGANSGWIIYGDALVAGFADWSWAVHDLASPMPVSHGAFAISMEPDDYAGLYLRASAPLSIEDWGTVAFDLHGGTAGGQALRVYLQLGETLLAAQELTPPIAGTWQRRTIDFAALGAVGSFDGIIFQGFQAGDQPTVHVDEIELLGGTAPPPGDPISVSIYSQHDRRLIDPRIYGVNFGTGSQLTDVGWPLRRWGGNSTTRHNWRADVHNTAFDYFFQNIVDEPLDPTLLPFGSTPDQFVDETLQAGAGPILTMPLIGWAPVDVREKRWAFSQQKYGPQTLDECRFYGDNPPFWCSADAGDGNCDPSVNTTGYCSSAGRIVGNDPTDTSQAIDPQWVQDWVAHLVGQFGTAAEGGVGLYALDNEPMLWNSTHRDVHPTGLDYDGLWQRTVDYAQAIKAADPSAETLGPAVWGWCAYFTSAADTELPGSDCLTGPDRDGHDGLPLLEWYLDQICSLESESGFRAVDYLDIHFYPQNGVDGIGAPNEDPANSALRLRSTRELWDPTYVSESWINQPVRLVPRMRDWIAQRCPGTKLAITEYRWGTDEGLSSALAQTEILAIFGREGVDLATRWVAPSPDSLVEGAFRMFVNYDGNGSGVYGTSIRALSSNLDAVTAYAVDGDGETFILLVNKDTVPRPVTIDLSSTPMGDLPLRTYRLDAAGYNASSDTPVTASQATPELPARSATLLVGVSGVPIFVGDFEDGDLSDWSTTSP